MFTIESISAAYIEPYVIDLAIVCSGVILTGSSDNYQSPIFAAFFFALQVRQQSPEKPLS